MIEAIKYVDEVGLTGHELNDGDMSVCRELAELKPDIFANGGDRNHDNIPEVAVCREIGCRMVFSVGGGKVQSSSWLIGKAADSFSKAKSKSKPRK